MSDKKEEKKEGEDAAVAAPKKSKKKLFIIVGAVLVLVLGGGVGFMLMGSKPVENEEAVVEEARHIETAELGVFVVNLSETARFLKVKLLIDFDATALDRASHAAASGGEGHGGGGSGGGKEEAGIPDAMKKREPMMRDAIIKTLSAKKADEVLTVEGKELLKDELLEAINSALGFEESVVVAIYFSDFLVQ